MNIAIHAKVMLMNTENRILLMKRSYGNKTWDMPGGAIVMPETIEEGLMREVKEETGITHIHGLQTVECVSSYSTDEDKYVVFIGFMGTTPEHAIHLSNEHEEYKWVTQEEILEVGLTPYLVDFISKYRKTFP